MGPGNSKYKPERAHNESASGPPAGTGPCAQLPLVGAWVVWESVSLSEDRAVQVDADGPLASAATAVPKTTSKFRPPLGSISTSFPHAR